MSQGKQVICFVDDDPAEVEAFDRVFRNDFDVVAKTTLQAVSEEIARKGCKPNLFVLDLYFSKGRQSSDAERDQMIKLKEEVDKARKRLSDYLSTIGQSREGGIEIMESIRKDYPAIPIVFYTRKGTLDDAVACIDKGADGVIPKAAPASFNPDVDRLSQIEQATREHHDTLVNRFSCMASSPNPLKKLIRLAKSMYTLWRKS